MRFSIAAIVACALAATALPNDVTRNDLAERSAKGLSTQQAADICGDVGADISCCNEEGDKVTEANTPNTGGLLGSLVGGALNGEGLKLFTGCSKLSVAAVIGVADILDNKCSRKLACCQDVAQPQSGVLNVGLPCVALAGLI